MMRLHWRRCSRATNASWPAARGEPRVRALAVPGGRAGGHVDRVAGRPHRGLPRLVPHAARAAHPRSAAQPAAIGRRPWWSYPRSDRCCGFGGTFSVRYPEVSTAMADDKLGAAEAAGIKLIASADPGCVDAARGTGVAYRRARWRWSIWPRPGERRCERTSTSARARAAGRSGAAQCAGQADRSPVGRPGARDHRRHPDFDALRDRAARSATRPSPHLPRYLEQLQCELRAKRSGACTGRRRPPRRRHRRRDRRPPRRPGGQGQVDGCPRRSGLNERLEAAGLEVFETDLGEFIVQTCRRAARAHPAPGHPLEPGSACESCSSRSPATRWATIPTELTAFARGHLRERVRLRAPVGITGVNFGVAETGTLVVVSNEGNGRMCCGACRRCTSR